MAQLNANENIADMICGSWADSIRSKSLGEKLLMFGVNRVLNKKYTPTHSTQMSLNANQSYRIPHTPDYVGLELTGLYTTQSTDSYEHYGVNYITSPQKANRWKNLYLDNRLKDFQWSAKASYTTLQKNVHTIGIHASFALEYFNVDKNNYNLATLSGWGMDTEYELGMLPSQQALLGTLEKVIPIHTESILTDTHWASIMLWNFTGILSRCLYLYPCKGEISTFTKVTTNKS